MKTPIKLANDNFNADDWIGFDHILVQRHRPPTVRTFYFRLDQFHLWGRQMGYAKAANSNVPGSRSNLDGRVRGNW